jgi:RHS repeat-associated protein
MRLSSLTFARYNYDTAWNLNYRTNNGSLSTFIVDTKNGLTSFAARNVYDGNGNMVTNNNNHNVLVYDDENQLTRYFHYQNNFANIVAGDTRSDFIYDGLARLRKRIEWVVSCNAGQSAQGAGAVPNSGGGGNGCTWGEVSETWYVYDGRRVIQERDSNNVPTVSYTRGNDLSVSLEGAGGIGGLLARSSGYSSGNWTSHADYYADGNGNITSLIDSNQAVVASYRYDPFGNTISKSGGLGDANVYRFSSKEVHVNSGMYYYGFRFYDPNLQRWINRDPIQEGGGVNLYSFARNCAIGFIDVFGDSGTLTINTTGAGSSECAAGTGSKIGHAWITYTPDNGETTSYGTWGRGTFAPKRSRRTAPQWRKDEGLSP